MIARDGLRESLGKRRYLGHSVEDAGKIGKQKEVGAAMKNSLSQKPSRLTEQVLKGIQGQGIVTFLSLFVSVWIGAPVAETFLQGNLRFI